MGTNDTVFDLKENDSLSRVTIDLKELSSFNLKGIGKWMDDAEDGRVDNVTNDNGSLFAIMFARIRSMLKRSSSLLETNTKSHKEIAQEELEFAEYLEEMIPIQSPTLDSPSPHATSSHSTPTDDDPHQTDIPSSSSMPSTRKQRSKTIQAKNFRKIELVLPDSFAAGDVRILFGDYYFDSSTTHTTKTFMDGAESLSIASSSTPHSPHSPALHLNTSEMKGVRWRYLPARKVIEIEGRSHEKIMHAVHLFRERILLLAKSRGIVLKKPTRHLTV